MKKLLGILGAFSLTATAALATVACGPENVVETDYSEENVQKVIEEIVAQPIEYEDKFLFNYGITPCDTLRSSISNMIMSEKTSLNLFSKLLNKIIIDKILSKLPLLFENYPDFTLYTILNASSEASEIFTNIASGEKGIFKSYDVCWNLYSINNVDSFEIFDGPTILTSDASLYGRATTTFKSTMNRHGTGAQYVISEAETSFFSFKQTEYIEDSKERLNYITELINYSNNINILEGDESIKLLSPMSFDPRQYPNLISMQTIDEIIIKNNYSEYKEIFEKTLIGTRIDDYIMKEIEAEKIGFYNKINIELELCEVLGTKEIEEDPKLKKIFGLDPIPIERKDQFSFSESGILVYNIKIQFCLSDVTADNWIEEKLLITIDDDWPN